MLWRPSAGRSWKMRRYPDISGALFVVLALMLLMLPLKWVLAAVLAALFHELCHFAAVKLCGGAVGAVSFGRSGAMMEASGLSRSREVICVLAGPLGGLALLLFARWIPRTAVCAAIQSVYNLIPVYPLDGGRILRCLGLRESVCLWTEWAVLVALFAVAFYGCVCLKLGLMPLILAAILLLRVKSVKKSCKPAPIWVQ